MVIFLASLATAVTAGLVAVGVSAKVRRVGRPASSADAMAIAGRARRDARPVLAGFDRAGVGTYLVVFAVTSLPIVALMPALVVATLPRAYFGPQARTAAGTGPGGVA